MVLDFPSAFTFEGGFGSNAAEAPVKYQSDTTILRSNLVASGLRETSYDVVNKGPESPCSHRSNVPGTPGDYLHYWRSRVPEAGNKGMDM